MTCGELISDLWFHYKREVDKRNSENAKSANKTRADGTVGTPVGDILDAMGVTDICCRRMLLTQTDDTVEQG
jgi:DNA-directed RNA polymerase subunit N (RpoN/RPB10)